MQCLSSAAITRPCQPTCFSDHYGRESTTFDPELQVQDLTDIRDLETTSISPNARHVLRLGRPPKLPLRQGGGRARMKIKSGRADQHPVLTPRSQLRGRRGSKVPRIRLRCLVPSSATFHLDPNLRYSLGFRLRAKRCCDAQPTSISIP